VYVTVKVSPDTTERSPGDEKSAAENNVPVVPDLVLLLVKNAPAIVAVPLMLNVAAEAEFVATDGLAVVGVPKVQTGRVAWLYETFSAQPACEDIVSAAAIVVPEPGPVIRPKYHAAV
jgi:hypothetical protein